MHRGAGDADIAAELDAVDALYPDLLGRWIEEAVEPYIAASREAVEAREERDREVLAGVPDKIAEA